MPSASALEKAGWPSGLTYGTAPAIVMSYSDHRQTASEGSSAAAKAYRNRQTAFLLAGNFRAALDMDEADVRAISTKTTGSPSAYDAAIVQLEDYARKQGLIP